MSADLECRMRSTRASAGALLVVLVTAASVQDRDGGRRVLARLRFAMPSVALVFAWARPRRR